MLNKNRQGYFVSDEERECTNCGDIFLKTSKMTLCKICNSNRVKSLTPEWKMHQRAKMRSKERGHEFNIDITDIVIPDICPVLGLPLNVNSGKSGAYPNSPSLDRIDNRLGYIKGNIRVLSQQANAMKHCASNSQLHKFADWIKQNVPDTD